MIDMSTYGWRGEAPADTDCYTLARVTAVHRERFEIACRHGECWAVTRANAYRDFAQPYPTVGDFVRVEYHPGDSVIVETLPRRAYFARRDPDPQRGEQAVAANFDAVLILTSLNAEFNRKRLERYLIAARSSGAEPVVVLTKADLVEDAAPQREICERLAPGVRVAVISALNGTGFEGLADVLLSGNTLVLLGSSGVGKSSLLNALAGETRMHVNTIREDDAKGHHTTTHRQLELLGSGVLVIDTPGMRELGMWDADEGLHSLFADCERLEAACRFADCRHAGEPGCAVATAIADGALDPERWASYQQLRLEDKMSQGKARRASRQFERRQHRTPPRDRRVEWEE